MSFPTSERGDQSHEIRHTSAERPLSQYPLLVDSLGSVSGLLRAATMTCQSYAVRSGDYDMYGTLGLFLHGLRTATEKPNVTSLFATTPGGHKKYPQNLTFRTPSGEVSQAVIVSLFKPKDKDLKGKIDVVYGVIKPDGEIEEKSGISLEKVSRIRQTNYRRRRLKDFVVQPSCLSVTQEGKRRSSTVNAYGEIASEFDAFYAEIQRVYRDAFT